MSVLQQVYVASIEVGERARHFNEAWAATLAERIAQSNWVNPIELTKEHRLIRGLHRLRACQILGRTEIPAIISTVTEMEARQRELRDDLDRLALSPLEEMQHKAELQDIHEALHPETRNPNVRGGPGRGKTTAENAAVSEASTFTAEMAAATGRSERSVRQDLQIVRNLAPDVQDALAETPLAHSRTALLELSREEPEVQREVAQKVVAATVAAASVQEEHRPDERPLNRADAPAPKAPAPIAPAQKPKSKPVASKPAPKVVREAAEIARVAAVQAKEKPATPALGYITLDAYKQLSQNDWRERIGCQSTKGFNRQDSDSIEWAQFSWNPVTGCLHDCPYCYARDIANRFYPQGFEPSFHPDRLAAAQNTAVPAKADGDVAFRNVFACSMADLWGRWVPAEWIQAVLDTIEKSQQWNFLFLTKFPRRMSEFALPENAWVGTSVDCQARVKNAEAAFANVNAKVRWLSIEPMLEPLKFERLDLFHWVVIGGASSSSKTPEWMPPFEWLADLHQQARAAGCRIYHKTNLGIHDSIRLREFPWGPQREVATLPESLRYLQSRTAPNQKPEGAAS